MNEELNRAFEQISDEHIIEAAVYQRQRFPWLRAIAAVLALVIAWTAIWASLDFPPTIFFPTEPRPTVTGGPKPEYPSNLQGIQSPATLQLANLVAGPMYPQMVQHPGSTEADPHSDEYYHILNQWYDGLNAQYNQPDGYADSLKGFWGRSIAQFLSGEGNRAYSPATVYMAMAMLAETTGGNSRQQILDLLGAESIEALRTQAGHVWNAQYCDDGESISLLANSLWLDEAYRFKDPAVQNLVNHYYTSIFNGDLGTEEMNEQLRTWLNSQTGGLLQDRAKELELSEYAVFALASTIYFAAGWENEFSPDKTADGVFHCEDGDLTTPFMNQSIQFGTYYRGSNFGAVRLNMSKGGMWLILPDEGVTVEEVLAGDEYLTMTLNPHQWTNKNIVKINLSLPKFDISSQADLIDGMKKLGLSDVFNPHISDFTPMTDADQLAVGKIDHTVRVAIDEEGVVAAAYTVIEIKDTGAPMPPRDEINFVLDRPFLFLVTDDIPLFAGVVEQP